MSTRKAKQPLPVYDDWGNLQQFTPDERTFERSTGCWNCKSFDIGDLFEKRVEDCFRRDIKVFLEQGIGFDKAGVKANVTKMTLLGYVAGKPNVGAARRGMFGICLKGKAEGDFVACKHLCLDGWDGKQGVKGSMAPGQKLDEPVEALFDDLGETPRGDRK